MFLFCIYRKIKIIIFVDLFFFVILIYIFSKFILVNYKIEFFLFFLIFFFCLDFCLNIEVKMIFIVFYLEFIYGF